MLDYLNSNIARIYKETEKIFKKYNNNNIKYSYVLPKNQDDDTFINIIMIDDEFEIIKEEMMFDFKDSFDGIIEISFYDDEIVLQFEDEFTNEEWIYKYIFKTNLDMLKVRLEYMASKYDLDYIKLYNIFYNKDKEMLNELIDNSNTVDELNKKLLNMLNKTKEEFFL